MTNRPPTCQARHYSDQKICNRCGLIWDTNDPEPPACLTRKDLARKALTEIKALIEAIPDE